MCHHYRRRRRSSPDSCEGPAPGKDARYSTFWRRSAAMTAELPWTSVGVEPRATVEIRGFLWQVPRLMALPRGKCHGCSHGTCRGSVRGKLCRTNLGNPRKLAAIATAASAEVSAAVQAVSTAIRGHCHGNAVITMEVRGRPRQLPRQFPRTSNRSNFHGHPRQSAAMVTTILR